MKTYCYSALFFLGNNCKCKYMSSQLNFHVIKEIFERFKEADPEPKGELNHTNVFTLLVAVA